MNIKNQQSTEVLVIGTVKEKAIANKKLKSFPSGKRTCLSAMEAFKFEAFVGFPHFVHSLI